MTYKIAVGETFLLPQEKGWPQRVGVRLPDDPAPMFECERMRVKILASGAFPEQNFPVEPEWFYQRKLDYKEITP